MLHAASSNTEIQFLSDPQEAIDGKWKIETSLFSCRIDLDFNGYYTSFPKEEKTLNQEAMKPHFQSKTTRASANKVDIAITLYPTNTEWEYHIDKT